MSLESCFERGQLRKIKPDVKKAQNSIRIAQAKLETAKKQLTAEIFDGAFITAYTIMFHVARALLFKDGYKERSHYCLYRYIAERYKYKLEAKYINELNSLRLIRHSVLYGDEENLTIREVQQSEAESSIKTAEGFLQAVKKILF